MLTGVHGKTAIHKRANFPGLEELFTVASGYLVNHSSKDIFGVTIASLDLENVDFDILYVIIHFIPSVIMQLFCCVALTAAKVLVVRRHTTKLLLCMYIVYV